MNRVRIQMPVIAVLLIALSLLPSAASQSLPARESDQLFPDQAPRPVADGQQQLLQFAGQEAPAVRQFREMVYAYRYSDCCFLDVRLVDGSTAYGSIAVANLVWFEVLDPNTGQRTRVDYDRIQKLKSVPKNPAQATAPRPVPKALLVIKNWLVLPLFPFWYWLFWDGC